ncbi:MAG: 50S ribosomal protein L24 [Gemmatales bacterium]|nr:MAG: 50S ribosomal protein L24 [Gemmatales bacterium]
MNIRKDDRVEVQTGDDRGTIGRVLRVLPNEGKVVVEGVNRVYKHLKPSRQNPQGGRLSKEMPIDISNVLLVCPTCKVGTRMGRRYADDGHKVRYCKKCGNEYPGRPLSKPRPRYAKK